MTKTFKYNSKLVGVTFEGRQAVIHMLATTRAVDRPLRVRREADNKYDPNAVAVDVLVDASDVGFDDPRSVQEDEWVPIGYIAKDKNQEIAKTLDADMPVSITLSGITGGNGKSYGVNIELNYKQAPEKKQPEVVKTEETAPVIVRPSKEEANRVLEYLLSAVNNPKQATVETLQYNSVLLGKNIELIEKDGHKSLEGYLSGSKFPAQFYEEFDKEKQLQFKIDKFNVSKQEVADMWDINSKASTNFGNSIHYAMENYDRNFALGDKIKSVKTFKTKPDEVGPNKALNRNPLLKKVVESFHEKFGGDYTRFNEEFIWDQGFKLSGSVDRIKVIDFKKRVIRIQDFKTDADINEKKYQLTTSPFYKLTQGTKPVMGKTLLDYHWLQLSFYAFILQRAGWTVEGLDIYWMNAAKLVSGENPWEEFSHDVIDISSVITTGE